MTGPPRPSRVCIPRMRGAGTSREGIKVVSNPTKSDLTGQIDPRLREVEQIAAGAKTGVRVLAWIAGFLMLFLTGGYWKLSSTIDEFRTTVAKQSGIMEALGKQVDKLEARLEKVAERIVAPRSPAYKITKVGKDALTFEDTNLKALRTGTFSPEVQVTIHSNPAKITDLQPGTMAHVVFNKDGLIDAIIVPDPPLVPPTPAPKD